MINYAVIILIQKTDLDFSHLVLLIDLVHASHIICTFSPLQPFAGSVLVLPTHLFLHTMLSHLKTSQLGPESIREKYRLCRICTSYLGRRQVYVATLLTLACIHCTDYRLQCTPICHTTTDTQSPITHKPFQRPSADYSQPHSENLVNFLSNLVLTSTFLYGWPL